MMKVLILALGLVAFSTAAYANCFSRTIFVGAKVVICTVCIDPYGNRTETCV